MPFDLSERRQITALYCEFVVNSSEETRKGPPEEHEFLSAFDRILGNVVGEFHGYLENRSIGNRSLACFGYPEAREDDTIRAFHCARRLHEEVARLNTTTPSPVRLSIRTVLHTGPAVILRTNGREQLVLGTTVDTAEGLLHKANNDQILVTGPTRRLILGRLHPDEMVYVGSNLSDKLETYQIQKDSKGDSGSWTDEPDTPFIGREREVDLLRSCCQLATDGRGQIILMTGEPGVGKSRLAHEVRRDSSAAMQWRQGQCVQRLANTPLVPFTEILRKMFAISSIGTAVEQRADLRSGLERLGCAVDESLPLLAPVLEIPLPEDVEQSPWSPEKRREMTFDLIIRLLLEPSEDTSFGILIEDLHWADPSTLELVGQLIPRIRAARGLLLMTARPEFSPPWESANHTSLDLSRLSTPVTGALIEAVAGGKGLPDDVVQLIVSRTDGIPLFVQELTRYLLESKHFIEQDDRWELREVLANLEVPTTLRSSLAARLERLGEAKPLLQLASVVGREFSLAVIGAVSEIEQEALSVALHQLVDAKLLRRRGYGRRARYLFRHALIQEAAYDSLLLKQRTDWHHRVAETLESRFPDIAISKPELLGHHLEHAQEPLRAVDYFHSAGKLHTNDSAFVEAMSHFERGLRLLETVPHSPRTSRQELSLQMARCRPLLATEGYTTEVFQTIASRAQELHGGSKDLHELHPFLFRFAYLYVNQGDNTHVHEAALRCRETAERIGSPVALATSDFVDGAIHLFQGSLKRSLALLDSSAAVFDVSQHSEISWLYGDNPMLKSIMARAWVHTLAGNFPGAWRDLDSLRQIARELEEPFNTIRAVMFKVGLSCDLEYQEGISDLIEEAHSLSVENNVPHYRILAETHRGLSAMFDGSRDAFRDVRGRIEEMRALGAMALLPVYLTRLARAHLEVDQLEMGLRAAEEALAVTEGNLGIFYEAESFRLKGALLARLGNDLHEADRCFQRALLIARRQGALLFEIRAALGRVHLAKDFKTSDEPIDQLAASLGRFNGVVPESERAQAELLCDDLRLAREWQANCGRRVPLDTH
ncbi:MAG: AAA family ATPase [Acidobacteriota bacterium]